MITLDKTLPAGYYYREAWMMQDIWSPDGTTFYVPPSCKGGHRATLTGGAYKATSTNGLIMRGAEKVTITDAAAISINDNLTVVLPTFVLNTLFSSASGADMGILNLNNGSVIARLNSTTGAMTFIFDDADGGADYTVSSTKVSWATDTEWQVSFTFDKDAGASSVELFVNGVSDSTHALADTVLTIPAGDTVYGYDNTTYLTGKITRGLMVWDTIVLNAAMLLKVYKGIPFTNNLKLQHMLDEGMGLAVDDKVAAALDGLISGTNTADIWDYDVRQACMGLDGRTGYAVTANIDCTGDITLVWVAKVMSDYTSLGAHHHYVQLFGGGTDLLRLRYEWTNDDFVTWQGYIGATGTAAVYDVKPTIGDYVIVCASYTLSGDTALMVNGIAGTSQTGGNPFPGLAQIFIGSSEIPNLYDVSKPIFCALIDGALTKAWARQYSRTLDNWLALDLGI